MILLNRQIHMQREVIKYLNVKNVYQNKNLIKKNNKL